MSNPCVPTSRRRIVLGLAALPLAGSTALAAGSAAPAPSHPPADLAAACIQQVKRLARWDANPGSLSEEEGHAELERTDALFRRAIEEPSSGPRDLAGKATLMLDDLDRFYPEDRHSTDDLRLTRVILREIIAMGGLA